MSAVEQAAQVRAEITAAIEDYSRIFRVPYSLAPNLALASRAIALADAALLRAEPVTVTTVEELDAGSRTGMEARDRAVSAR